MAKIDNVALKSGGILKQLNKLIGEEKMMKILSCEVKILLSERHLFLCDLFNGHFFIKKPNTFVYVSFTYDYGLLTIFLLRERAYIINIEF